MAWRPSTRLARRVLIASAFLLAAMFVGPPHVRGEVPPRLDLNVNLVIGSALLALGVPHTSGLGLTVSPPRQCGPPTPSRSYSVAEATTVESLQPSSSSVITRWVCNAWVRYTWPGESHSGTCFEERLVRKCFGFLCWWFWEPTGKKMEVSCSNGVAIGNEL